MCQSCQKASPTTENVIGEEAIHLCKSTCDARLKEEKVCDKCRANGQVSYLPCLRACDRCLQNNQKCNRRVFVALTTDCEEGNKQAMLSIKQALKEGTIDKELSLLVSLPDCSHVGKSLKGSFSNWFLKPGDERGNLAILRTLRNKSDVSTKKVMRKHLPKNDYVRNKDRQDPVAVIKLTDDKFTSFLGSLGYVNSHNNTGT